MTCRHSPGDTDCSSHPYNVECAEARVGPQVGTMLAKNNDKPLPREDVP